MITLKTYFILFFLCFIHQSFGSLFQSGKIIYLNGDVKTGFLAIPSNADVKTIEFKTGLGNDQIDLIQSSDLKYIAVQSEDGNNYLFERTSYAYKLGAKPKKNQVWLYACVKGYATLYVAASEYITDKKGNVIIQDTYIVGKDLPTFNFFIKKGNEDIAYFFGMTGNLLGLNKYLKKTTIPFLVDYPELVERIKNDEFTHKDYKGIVQLYNEYMKNLKPIEKL